MFQSLDCLATQGIIHRDVRPENILYLSIAGQYHLQPGDFGLSNEQTIAKTRSGPPFFMAPEIYRGGKQMHKTEVWPF